MPEIEEVADEYELPQAHSQPNTTNQHTTTPATSSCSDNANEHTATNTTITSDTTATSESSNHIPNLTAAELLEQGIQPSTDKALEYKKQGNVCFAKQQFDNAITCYTNAILISPSDDSNLSVYYNNRSACYLQLKQYKQCISDASESIKLQPENNIKAYLRRAQAYEHCDNNYSDAVNDYKCVLKYDPVHKVASSEIRRLQPLADAALEQQKAEMMSKLKGLGNSILGKFGMSLDNFQATKDPATGSYSISMNK